MVYGNESLTGHKMHTEFLYNSASRTHLSQKAAQAECELNLQGDVLLLKSQPKLQNGKIQFQNILNSSITTELIPDITWVNRVKRISEFFLKEINVLHDVGAAASKTMYEHSLLNTSHVTTDSNRKYNFLTKC